jgi:hypothetical protein
VDSGLPTIGTGAYEWRGFLPRARHPQAVEPSDGLLLNWNNKSAPGFMHGDDEPFGSVHRVELFDKFPARVKLTDDVGVMNRAATEDVRSPVWPIISRVLRSGPAPNARDQQVVEVLDDWVRRDAPRLDADVSGKFDDAGPAIMDQLWPALTRAVLGGVLNNEQLDDVSDVRGLGGLSAESYVDKDLRTLLGYPVKGRFNLRYCGGGSLKACRNALWITVHVAADQLAAQYGSQDPTTWLKTASRTGFQPGLIPNTIRTTNRPTFQQVIELERHPADG